MPRADSEGVYYAYDLYDYHVGVYNLYAKDAE